MKYLFLIRISLKGVDWKVKKNSRLRKLNEKDQEKETFSMAKAFNYINENPDIKQKFSDYVRSLPPEIIRAKDPSLYKYLISYDVWNYLTTKFNNMNEVSWYRYDKDNVQEMFVVQNSEGVDNPLIKCNKYYGLTDQDQVQDTIIVSYDVNEQGVTQKNNFRIIIEPGNVVNTVVQNVDMLDIYIDGTPYTYGGEDFQKANEKKQQMIEKYNNIEN